MPEGASLGSRSDPVHLLWDNVKTNERQRNSRGKLAARVALVLLEGTYLILPFNPFGKNPPLPLPPK
jgi:hypothetical protein